MEQRNYDKLICLAAVAAAHGVRGAMKLRCFTEDPVNVTRYGPVFDEQGQELFRLKPIGPCKGGVIVQADGIQNRNQAEALRGKELFVPRSALPDADDDEFYHEDLIGLVAVDDKGPIGRVCRIDDHGAASVLEIEDKDGQMIALPFHAATCFPSSIWSAVKSRLSFPK